MHSVSRFRARLARFDAHSKRGTESSNPPPSSGESTNFRCDNGHSWRPSEWRRVFSNERDSSNFPVGLCLSAGFFRSTRPWYAASASLAVPSKAARRPSCLRGGAGGTYTTAEAFAAAGATTSIPIVVGPAGEQTMEQLAGNFAKPVPNVTGGKVSRLHGHYGGGSCGS